MSYPIINYIQKTGNEITCPTKPTASKALLIELGALLSVIIHSLYATFK